MIQTPMPPMPPGLDPNFVFNQVVPIVAAVVVILVVAVALRGLLRTPVGEAIAERIRTRAQRRWGTGGEDPQRVAELEAQVSRSEEHTSELQSLTNLVCRLLLEKKKKNST